MDPEFLLTTSGIAKINWKWLYLVLTTCINILQHTNQTSTSPFKSRYINEYPIECLQGILSFNFLSCLPKVTRRSWKLSFICFTNMGLSFYFFQSYYKTKGYIWSGSILLHFSLEKFKYFFFLSGGRGFLNASKLKNGIPKIYLF